MCSIPCIKVNLSFQQMRTYKIIQLYMFYLLFLALTHFGHSCDHLQGVLLYKYQEYSRNHIRYITKAFCCVLLTDIRGYSRPNDKVVFYNILLCLKEDFKGFLRCFYNGQSLEELYYTFYVISVVLLVFILWNTLKMVK